MIPAAKPSLTLSPAEARGRYAFTVRDYHQLVSSGHFTRTDRIELIEGELTIMPPIGPEHSYRTRRITNLLPAKLPAGAMLQMNEPITIPDHSEPQPDAAVVREREDGYRKAHPLPEDVLLIIEVADTSVEFDMKVKAHLYARAGIPEYWVVDVKAGCLQVFTSPSEEGYQNCQMLGAEDSVTCQCVPGLQITAKQLLG